MTQAVQARRRVEHCMGTVFSIDVRDAAGPAVLDEVVRWLHHVDETFSTYRADSAISRLARGDIGVDGCSDEVREVLRHSERITAETQGWFDVRAGGRLDPSGYVKGWAIERAADLLYRAGSRNHCVNGGGDVQCEGVAGPGRPWSVGIADPREPGSLVATVRGDGRLAVATSGSAERGAHIHDPHTRRRADTLLSVTAVGRDLADVDAYATAAFAMGDRAQAWLAGRPDLSALVVGADGALWQTPAH